MRSSVLFVTRLAIGLVFARSAYGKVAHPIQFARGIADYQLLSISASYITGALLIPTEVILAICHITGYRVDVASILGLVILITFAIGVGVQLRRGRQVPCLCFDVTSDEKISWRTLVRLAFLATGELIVFTATVHNAATPRIDAHGWLAGFAWASVVLTLGYWVLNVDLIVSAARLRPASTFGMRKSSTT